MQAISQAYDLFPVDDFYDLNRLNLNFLKSSKTNKKSVKMNTIQMFLNKFGLVFTVIRGHLC
ncbi:hypothetical protein J2W55_002915 [Mucilaginibacter pocheonensis]|uniref:Uncharacterized protein n=1 Tax=Mucilaginibacter pocheonensis TaxID=398050 RepID=A0ABU1TCC9_9SPHI|nr:hypothetical protein [Mucilaginibacter pocheonensis]